MSGQPPSPPFQCPTCGPEGQLISTSDGELVNFLCLTCGSCWHPELGWLRRVEPDRCPGCAHAGVCRLAVELAGEAGPPEPPEQG